MKIDSKVAVVTGAASGIGNAVARRLVEGGAALVGMVDLTADIAESTDRLNAEFGGNAAVAFQGDVTNRDFRQHVFQALGERDVVRICVPAAGILRDAMAVKVDSETGEAELYDEDLFRKVLDVNLVHPVYWTMQMIGGIASHRARHGSGRWTSAEPLQGAGVIIGSVSCRGNRGQVSYSSAKSGLNAAAKTLNVEGAYHGVQVKALHPGFVATPMVEQLPDGMFEEQLRKMIPLDRKILPEEIAEAIVAIIENPIISGPVWADGGFPPMA